MTLTRLAALMLLIGSCNSEPAKDKGTAPLKEEKGSSGFGAVRPLSAMPPSQEPPTDPDRQFKADVVAIYQTIQPRLRQYASDNPNQILALVSGVRRVSVDGAATQRCILYAVHLAQESAWRLRGTYKKATHEDLLTKDKRFANLSLALAVLRKDMLKFYGSRQRAMEETADQLDEMPMVACFFNIDFDAVFKLAQTLQATTAD